jgi:hypothetical protein
MTDMTVSRLSHDSNDSAYIPVLWFTVIFALITYAAISMRAVLSPFEVNTFVDAKRALSVVLGAFVLWLAIGAADRQSDQGPGAQIFAMLNVAIPGAIALLLTREAYDLAASGELAQRLALNVRWMLTWIGYFAAAAAAFLALSYHRQLQVALTDKAGVRETALHSRPRPKMSYEVADLDFDPRSPN